MEKYILGPEVNTASVFHPGFFSQAYLYMPSGRNYWENDVGGRKQREQLDEAALLRGAGIKMEQMFADEDFAPMEWLQNSLT